MSISTRQARALGWTRVDGGKGKIGSRWGHNEGWRLEHCNHPTALYPWSLYAPDGQMVCMGATLDPPDHRLGHAWATLEGAMVYVAEMLCGLRALPGVRLRKEATP